MVKKLSTIDGSGDLSSGNHGKKATIAGYGDLSSALRQP